MTTTMYKTDEERELERLATALLVEAGYDRDGLPYDELRRKKAVEYDRRTLYTPCGGAKPKPR